MANRLLINHAPGRVAGAFAAALMTVCLLSLAGCQASPTESAPEKEAAAETEEIFTEAVEEERLEALEGPTAPSATDKAAVGDADAPDPAASAPAVERPAITVDFRAGFDHGPKPAAFQKYIVLHDTEGDSDAAATIDWWDSNGNRVAAHFIVNRDGSIWQCVPLDRIAHHAGYGDTGHNERYGIVEDGRDDMAGAVPIGADFADYAMNAHSVGIEMVHVGGEGAYPEAQLEAVDALIAYIDGYFGFESAIIDHKAWRSGNSDTSPEFADHLASYQSTRRHAG